MLEAGYAPETARQGRVYYEGRLVSPRHHSDVAARLDELQAAAREQTVVTIGDIVATMQRAIDVAEADRNPNAMVQAAMGQARVLGLVVKRTETTIKPLELWTDDEIEQLLGEGRG